MFVTVKDAGKKYDLSSLRHCISAGEPLNPEVIKRWKDMFNLDIYDGIGMTEIMVYLSNMEGLEIKPGSCGRPQPGHICEIVDDDGNPLPPGEPGVLAIKKGDPGLFTEYWNKPEQTSKSFKNDWFLTGDVLYKDEDGYFWYAGRGDDMLKVGGIWVSPVEVESTLVEHEAVLECAVVGASDEKGLIKPKSFVVLRRGYEASAELAKELQEFVKGKIAPYKYPRWVEFVKELPKTATGKIQRFKLRGIGDSSQNS